MSDERKGLLQAEKERDGRRSPGRDGKRTGAGVEYMDPGTLDVPVLVRLLNSLGVFRILPKRAT